MTTQDKRIRQIVEQAIPLNPKCAIERDKEIKRRAQLRIEIEQLLRDTKPYDPRTELK